MRDIKFRGRTSDSKWFYGDLRHNPNELIAVAIFNDRDMEDWRGLPAVMPETVGQYTGLKDCDGKEIYEGDIVEYKYWHTQRGGWSEYRTVISQVAYKEHLLTFTLPEANLFLAPAHKDCVMKIDHPSQIKVIGNVHDNPELIKLKV